MLLEDPHDPFYRLESLQLIVTQRDPSVVSEARLEKNTTEGIPFRDSFPGIVDPESTALDIESACDPLELLLHVHRLIYL